MSPGYLKIHRTLNSFRLYPYWLHFRPRAEVFFRSTWPAWWNIHVRKASNKNICHYLSGLKLSYPGDNSTWWLTLIINDRCQLPVMSKLYLTFRGCSISTNDPRSNVAYKTTVFMRILFKKEQFLQFRILSQATLNYLCVKKHLTSSLSIACGKAALEDIPLLTFPFLLILGGKIVQRIE